MTRKGENSAGRLAIYVVCCTWLPLTSWWKADQTSQSWDMDFSVLSRLTWHISCIEMTGLCSETFYMNLSHVTQILNVTERWNNLWQELLLCRGSQSRDSSVSANAMDDAFYEFNMTFSHWNGYQVMMSRLSLWGSRFCSLCRLVNSVDGSMWHPLLPLIWKHLFCTLASVDKLYSQVEIRGTWTRSIYVYI